MFQIRDVDGKLIKSECSPIERSEPLIGGPSHVANDDQDLLLLLKEVMVGVNDVEEPDYEYEYSQSLYETVN